MAASSEPAPEIDPGSLNQPASILEDFSKYCKRLKDDLRNDQEAFMKQLLDSKFRDGDISLQQLAVLQSIRHDQEVFVKQPNSKLRDGYISQQQLTVLESIRDRIGVPKSNPTNVQFIWGALLQAIAVVVGVLFGVFTILSYKANETANSQSLAANQLALLGLCLSNPALNTTAESCETISQQAIASLSSLAIEVFGPPLTNSTSSPGSSNGPLGLLQSDKIALAVGIGIGVPSLLISAIASFEARRHLLRSQSRADHRGVL